LIDRGNVGLFVGYPDNHADDVYRIFNIKTKLIIKSRDLVWLNLSYSNWKLKNNNQQPFKVEKLVKKNFRSRRYPTDETVSKINGFLEPNVTEYFERG
jgi:hypothetical protein